MSKIGIFSPIYHRNKEVQKFLIHLLYSNFSHHDVYLCLGINGADANLKYFISSFGDAASDRFKKILIFDPEENLGKPALVNIMVNSVKEQTGVDLDYIVSIDSDFVTIDTNWLDKMIWVFENKGVLPIGALCANQAGANCHVLEKDPMVMPIGPYNVITRAGNEGVAGGLLMTPKSLWDDIGGYFNHRKYASDDGHYALACAQRALIMGMVQEVTFFHPHSDNHGYNSWKQRATNDTLGDEEKNGFNFTPPLV